jgi:PAS domain S-box-containing protein
MKFKRIIAALVILFVAAAVFFTLSILRKEERHRAREIVRKGNYLASIISTYPARYFENDRGEFFLKTLAEYAKNEGLTYFFFHDSEGNPRLSMVPGRLASQIPDDIQVASLYAPGLSNQVYKTADLSQTFYEFAKPIYENGSRAGTVRLGFTFDPIAVFSPDHFSQLALVAFVIITSAALIYFAVALAIKPLMTCAQYLQNECTAVQPADASLTSSPNISRVIGELSQSVQQVGDRIRSMQSDNEELASRLGVISFEKRRVLKILDSLAIGIIVTDMQETILLINENVLNILRLKREKVLDRPLSEILPQEDIAVFLRSQDRLTHSNVSRQAVILHDHAPDQTYRFSVTLYSDEEDLPIGKMITIENVTKEKMTENAQQSFIAHAAHELLTPLTNIKSYSEMLMDEEVEDVEVKKEFYNTINVQADRLTDLIKNLISVSKIEMGCLTIKKELVRSDGLFEECLGAVEAAAQKKEIAVDRKTPHTFPTLVGDKELLKVALINVLGNAVKYTPQGGSITFSAAEEEEWVNFDIIDTGYGIAADDLPHIFDRFFRSADPNIAGQMGSGLGLAITSEIVRLHEGDIDVQSHPGKGTHFTIRLPKEEYRLENT